MIDKYDVVLVIAPTDGLEYDRSGVPCGCWRRCAHQEVLTAKTAAWHKRDALQHAESCVKYVMDVADLVFVSNLLEKRPKLGLDLAEPRLRPFSLQVTMSSMLALHTWSAAPGPFG